MLEQAIIDAEALREVAMKNAEASVIEKYSTQIKEAVEEILNTTVLNEENEEETVSDEVEDQTTLAVADDHHEHDEDCGCEDHDEEEVLTLNLTDMMSDFRDEVESGDLDVSEMLDREEVAEDIVPEEIELDENVLASLFETDDEALEEEKGKYDDGDDKDEKCDHVPCNEDTLEEELDLTEEAINDVVAEIIADLHEEVKVDIADPLPKSGWVETKPALSQTEEYQEALESEIERVKETTNENKELKAQNKKLNETLNKVHGVLKETATANARLLYTNKVLTNSSLNERQKIKIVEALSKASSVEEAKIIFETLQSAVGTSANVKQPQSLSEAVTRNSSTYLPKSESKKEKTSPAADRWKILAGL